MMMMDELPLAWRESEDCKDWVDINDVDVVTQGVENIYTQHKPQLHDVLDQLLKGKLREAAFPYIGNTQLRDRSDNNDTFSQSYCTQYNRLLAS